MAENEEANLKNLILKVHVKPMNNRLDKFEQMDGWGGNTYKNKGH